jgi:hypothetical protein
MSLRKHALLACAIVAAALGGAAAVEPDPAGRATAYTYGGAAVKAKNAPRLETFRTGVQGGEPNIGITKEGTIWASAMHRVVKSTDRGTTWTPISLTGHVTTLDPVLYVDVEGERVYKSDLAGISSRPGTAW